MDPLEPLNMTPWAPLWKPLPYNIDIKGIKVIKQIYNVPVCVRVCTVGAGWGGAAQGFVSSSGAAFYESHHGSSVSGPRQNNFH